MFALTVSQAATLRPFVSELVADCYICLHAMVLVKIKLGWLTAISFDANITTVQPTL